MTEVTEPAALAITSLVLKAPLTGVLVPTEQVPDPGLRPEAGRRRLGGTPCVITSGVMA
jgi:hypothetical protein